MRVLLVTPPMTQLNTAYPATTYLTGFLRSRGYDARQADASIELADRLFSSRGLARVFEALPDRPEFTHFQRNAAAYIGTIDSVMTFLRGGDQSLATRLANRSLVPEGPRFRFLDDEAHGDYLGWAFGAAGVLDRARYLASLYLDDLADVIAAGIDPRFRLARYAEKLAASAPSFEPLRQALESAPTVVDALLEELTVELIGKHQPEVLGLSIPFPGNLYGGLRMARTARKLRPGVQIVLGGGYVNTELRELREPRLFDYVDYVTLDDGERPLLCLLEQLEGKTEPGKLLRTLMRREGKVQYVSDPGQHDIPLLESGTPTCDGLPLSKYLRIIEMPNPIQRIWSDTRWNKLTLAHGCYWRKCNFCDLTLDYIGRYEPAAADFVIDRMAALINETGETGFHFVDEAAPPALLRALSERILERGLVVSWWGNIRFDKAFTPELAELMARAGCVAVTGGLEVASDRLLKLMNKGVTVEQVARVTQGFRRAGILVHAYLMYGFPTETVQETVDSLERVRQLFAEDCLQSAYWHRFSATAHSPIGQHPARFGIRLTGERPQEPLFARNDLEFEDATGVDHGQLRFGLEKALYNFMQGVGLEADVREWFSHKVPKPKVPRTLIRKAVAGKARRSVRA